MKVAMLGWEFPPFVSGGLGVHCYELTKNLAKKGIKIDFYMPRTKYSVKSDDVSIVEVKEKIKIDIIEVEASALSPYPTKINILPGIQYSGAPLSEVYGFNFLRELTSYNRNCMDILSKKGKEYDLIHNHDWITVPAAVQAKNLINKPLVSTVHSTEYDRVPYPWEFILNIERIGLKAADRIITVSNRMRSQLMERFGADESKIRVIYNGVDATRFATRTPGETRGKRVLFLGRLTDQKGPVQFLYAARKVIEKEPDVRFIMAGEGPMLPFLISLSIQLGLQNNVVFTGYLPEEQLKRAYSMCDVYVMPSISEPFGITALEAMASGTPLILSKSSGVAEIANHCLKVDFWDIDEMANKMIALLRYAPLGAEMSRSGLAEVRNFTWERTAEQTIGVYRELISNR